MYIKLTCDLWKSSWVQSSVWRWHLTENRRLRLLEWWRQSFGTVAWANFKHVNMIGYVALTVRCDLKINTILRSISPASSWAHHNQPEKNMFNMKAAADGTKYHIQQRYQHPLQTHNNATNTPLTCTQQLNQHTFHSKHTHHKHHEHNYATDTLLTPQAHTTCTHI